MNAMQKITRLEDAREAMYRTLIISAGEEAFALHGYAETRMQEIAADAGISLKTLYHHFPGKDDLYQGIKNVRGQDLLAEIEVTVKTLAQQIQTEPLEVALAGMKTHLTFFMTHPNYLKIILHEGYAWFEERARLGLGQQELWQRGSNVVEGLLQHGIQSGVFVAQTPLQQMTKLISQQQTLLATWVADGMSESIEEVIETARAEFIRFFCVPQVSVRLLTKDGASLKKERPSWAEIATQESCHD